MYTNRKTAPLGWLKIYNYVIFPLNIIVAILKIISLNSVANFSFFIFYFFLELAVIVIAILGAIGLVKWKKYGVVCVYILQWTGAIGNIYALLFGEFGAYEITRFIITLVVCILWTVYFHNRAPLFDPNYIDPPSESITATTPQFCTQCGTKLLPNTNFCRNCGNKLTDK